MRRHPTAPVNVARISVATSTTDFTVPEADFAVLIRAAGFCRSQSAHRRQQAPASFDKDLRTGDDVGVDLPGLTL